MNIKRLSKHILIASLFFGLCLLALNIFMFAAKSGAFVKADSFTNGLIEFIDKNNGYLFLIRLGIYTFSYFFISPKLARQTNYDIKSMRYLVIVLCLIYELLFVRSVGVF